MDLKAFPSSTSINSMNDDVIMEDGDSNRGGCGLLGVVNVMIFYFRAQAKYSRRRQGAFAGTNSQFISGDCR